MHIRVRLSGKPEAIVVVESKLTKIEKLRRILKDKFDVPPKLQRLFYGGKLLEDGYTFHDYNIKLNDVIQLMVRIQLEESPEKKRNDQTETKLNAGPEKKENNETEYKDAKSELYAIGDLIDMRDREEGAWFEGKIVRIVHEPNDTHSPEKTGCVETSDSETCKETFDKGSDLEKFPPEVLKEENSNTKKGIAKYFSKSMKDKRKDDLSKGDQEQNIDKNLLYKVLLDGEEEESNLFCKLSEIRPRARKFIEIQDLKVGQKVMINYNADKPSEKGFWYDFKISEIVKLRTNYNLIGTIYLGPEAVPQNDTKVQVHDKIYQIEEVVPLAQRTEEYKKTMVTPPEKRSQPLNCLTCNDIEDDPCKDCGCFLCSGKEFPEKIILCDECNKGFHMTCLSPPLTDLPEEDWYCPSCKRDTNDVVAPGAAKQMKKASTTNRDWGRGMACIGKTKTCAMPANHFGPIPGVEVGMCWRFRIQLSELGVHRPPVSGIHGRDVEGAYSIVLSGGYEDDVDYGNEFTYTGSGGRDLSGNKRTALQSCDQRLTRENKALARNCAVKHISEEGADAGASWRDGKPVRVVRSYKMLKHFPKYAPQEGIRYDGIYKVVKYYPEKGLSGFRVWKYLLRRDDPSPAPWEPTAKQYTIVYPDGYLEAEAEKKALKEKNTKTPKASRKRALRDGNTSTDSESEESNPTKKRKSNGDQPKKRGRMSRARSPFKFTKAMSQVSIGNFIKSPPKKPITSDHSADQAALSPAKLDAINADTLNTKLWKECLEVCERQGKKDFVEHVTEVFRCIICQDVAVNPVTTPCLHNFCNGCLKLAFKTEGPKACPCCRNSLANYKPEPNETLKAALRSILAGYDAGKK